MILEGRLVALVVKAHFVPVSPRLALPGINEVPQVIVSAVTQELKQDKLSL